MIDYIIVQAGGRGTRMEDLTRNKPKALVPVDNLPMLFHLFRRYPDKRFIVIGDYKCDVLERYLRAFAGVDYRLIRASGYAGTCAGLAEAVTYIPDGERFLLIWCDLVLPDGHELMRAEENVIGISKDFSCRWSYEKGMFAEKSSAEHGVAGYFIFREKTLLADVPKEGEFVRWLQEKGYVFAEQPLYRTHEYGLYAEWDKLPKTKYRPFNRIKFEGDKVIKTAIDEQGRALAARESAWYRKLQDTAVENIPVIYGYDPLCMGSISGGNIYEYTDISISSKEKILDQIIRCLRQVHALGDIPVDRNSYHMAYLDKTYERLEKIRDLVPFAGDQTVNVNGRVCRNVFYHQERLEGLVMRYMPERFVVIHGDCTFSNILLRDGTVPVLIDPRGYFGTTEIYGDAAYDWAKLYYSLYSDYDQFNLKRFCLWIGEADVRLEIASNGWRCMEDAFFDRLEGEVTKEQMKVFLAVIWLSLTTYAWEDYDQICGAFYNGLYYLEEVL